METWDAIRARRNVREFSDQPISPDDLDRILEAGRLTPSSRNWQPWDFVAVTDSAADRIGWGVAVPGTSPAHRQRWRSSLPSRRANVKRRRSISMWGRQ